MGGFFRKKSFKIFVALICMICMISLVCNFGYPFLSSGTNTVTKGLSQVSAAVTASLDQIPYEELLSENEKLQQENAQLRGFLADYYDLKEENQKLWSFYDIKKENPTYTYVPSTVIRRDANDDFYSFTIDAGTALGVQVNNPVVTENGLIGMVVQCDISSSKVKTILSPEIKVGAIDKNTSYSGVITGSAEYCDKNLTLLTKIPSENKIKEGDLVTTSGVGGLFPQNIVIGKVKELSYDDYDASKFAVIEPYEDIRKTTNVLVLTDFDTKGQVSLEKTQSETQPTTTPATSLQDNE